MAKPPPPPVPAAAGGKGQSTRAAYNRYINSHAALKPYAQGIWNAANEWGLDPVYFAALLNFENPGADPNIASSKGAIGLGQVTPGKTPPWLGRAVTAQDLRNPGLNLRVAAWYFSQQLSGVGGGNYDRAYSLGYNPGYKPGYSGYRGSPFASIPKGYVVAGGVSPAQRADQAASAAAAKGQQPVLAMQQARQVLDPIYISYTGRPATNQQLKNWLAKPISTYQLTNQLSDPKVNPRFYTSPIWQTNYPSYEAVWKGIYGSDSTPDRNAVRYALVHNVGSTGFQQQLRDRPDYNTSQEYQGLYSQYSSQYGSIYGTPDATAHAKIDMAVRKGWNADQWKDFLRAQPEWQGSGEHQKMAIGLANALGFDPGLGGQQTVLGG